MMISTCSECAVRVNGFGYEEIDSCPLHAAAPEMLAILQEEASKDHGHTMSTPRETCFRCRARALLAKIEGT